LSTHPTAAAIAAARAAAAAQVRQAGAWSNPEVDLNVGRAKARIDNGAWERDTPYGGSLSQRLTWWGTRNARVAAAQAQAGAAEAEAQVARLGLQAEVRRAVIAYAAALESAAQAADDARIAADLALQTQTRHDAGEVDRATLARARLEATTAALHQDVRRRDVETALAVLRSWCGVDLPQALAIEDPFRLPTAVLDAERLAQAAEQHPHMRALADAAAAADASVSAERHARMPDLKIGIFADREVEQDAFGVTLGFELPLWNRNEAGIAAAQAAHAQAQAAARSERLRLHRDLTEALGAVKTASAEATALADQAVPVAAEAIRLRTTAYQSGEASLADLLESRRAANTVRSELREARRRASLAVIDLGLAVGDPALGTVPLKGGQP
jgi:cobalt-zinc-cadmium efflux system outer membrane protein